MLTKDETIWRAIPVETLRAMLSQIPDGHLIAVGPVGNLSVLGADEGQVGFIDLAEEALETYDPLFKFARRGSD